MKIKGHDVPIVKETLVCIGRSIRMSGTNFSMIADLFLSPDGTVSAVVHNSSGDVSDITQFISRMGFSGLNMIAADYSYKTEGQAAGIIDIMARCGNITFSESSTFSSIVAAKTLTPIILFFGRGSC